MILIFGGTTEGRKAVQVIDRAGKPFYYSTKGDLQEVNSLHGIRLQGAMNLSAMVECCRSYNIRLIIDAAHPFAEQLHQTIADASEQLHIPVIRFERIYPDRDKDIVWCETYKDAIGKLNERSITRLLALTGVQTIGKLKPFWQHTETFFRILNREESLAMARQNGFPEDKIIFYQSRNDEPELIRTLRPDAIILKESGASGGFTEKVSAARQQGVQVFAIKRPPLPDEFYTADGEHGLRRLIEQLLPGFYPLRTGITTGSCATAAAVAALKALIEQQEQTVAIIILPDGERISVPVAETSFTLESATATVIKDAGDDADVTHGMAIEVTVKPINSPAGREATPAIKICGGKGVGRVTLPGLGLEVGSPAINTGPRGMIKTNINYILSYYHAGHIQSLEVRVSVPDGEEIAHRTFNPRLGIVDGISIIGTSGIVQPFSIEAFISSIRKSMEVAQASRSPRVVINSGAKSEKYLRSYYAELPDAAFVHYGNYIGETLSIASDLGIPQLTLGVMIGKAVKLAEGHLDTHSKKITMNKAFLARVAETSGCSEKTIQDIDQITLARELWSIIPIPEQKPFFTELITLCYQHCAPLLPKGELTVLLISETGEIYDIL